ncbi:uncharacterized protein TNCT_1502 [Trichonephila clavata]|uniref:DUF7041 domain-containing protein n=1 Tax=Trichonephila clavata TaxID=2740835 RepID=A0A8X6LTV4_TRICU|nr:uncharacterized protein TNCT_1502 [Trichonephila clavata]
MNFTEFNLKQLLELGLRCPEIGAVNFNIIYLILKTIIKRQGFENLTPEFTFAYYGSQEDVEEETESSDEFDELPEQYSKRLGGVSEDLLKLKETIQQLSKRISDLESQPVHSQISDEDEESSEEPTDEDIKEEPEIAESEEIEKPKMKKENYFHLKYHGSIFTPAICKSLTFNIKIFLQDSEGYIVDKFDALLQDFDTVMNGYAKLGLQVEELDKIVNKKFELAKILNDTTKFNHVLSAVESNILNSVSDLVLKPPENGKYDALKKRLIEVHLESEDSKIRILLQGLELGDQRPSHLLTCMRSLAGDNVGEPLLKSLWLRRLPNGMQTILAALNKNLDQLATVADKINDLTFSQGINSVAATSKTKTAQLEQQIAQLTQQVSKLTSFVKRSRSPARNSNHFRNCTDIQTKDKELKTLISSNHLSIKLKPLKIGNALEIFCDVSREKVWPYVPVELRFEVFRSLHNLSHPGIRATKLLIQDRLGGVLWRASAPTCLFISVHFSLLASWFQLRRIRWVPRHAAKVSMEDDLERLKEKVDRLETYVYTGKHPGEDVGLEEKDHEDFEFVKAKAEAPLKEVDQVKANLAKIVRDLMALPVERRAEILEQKSETDVKKIRPSMKKAYEKFIEAANQVRGAKEAELKDMMSAEQISIGNVLYKPEVSSEELILKGDKKRPKTAKERFKTAAQTINIIKAKGNTEHEARVVRVQKRKASHSMQDSEDTDEEQFSSEEEESSSSFEDDTSKKAGFRQVDSRALNEFKKSILNYVKTHTEEMLTTFMEKIKMVKISIANVQKENERLKIDVQYVMDRLIILETNQNKLQQRILVLEEKERANSLELENIIIELDKKAERSDSTLENKKFLNALQEEIIVLNETTSADLESMKKFLKNFASKLQEDLDEKISGFEMDIRLEPLAGRLKKQEKLLKEIFLKIRVLECQSMGPIEVKRYVHCEDGKRVKPLQNMMTQWNQSELSFFGNDKLLEENIANQIEADVEKSYRISKIACVIRRGYLS